MKNPLSQLKTKLFTKLGFYVEPKQRLLRWLGRFTVLNAVIFILIGAVFVWMAPLPQIGPYLDWNTLLYRWLFVGTTLLGHFSLLALLAMVPAGLMMVCWPAKKVVIPLAILTQSVLGFGLLVDAGVYHLFHYHMFGLISQMLFSGSLSEVIGLSAREMAMIGLLGVVVVVVETALAYMMWRQTQRPVRPYSQYGKMYTMLASMSLLLSYTLMVSTCAINNSGIQVLNRLHLIAMEAQAIPLYENLLATLLPVKDIFKNLQLQGAGLFAQLEQVKKPLAYPLKLLRSERKPVSTTQPLNILIIGLDAWRWDKMTPEITPNIYQFSRQALNFTQHFSGGDATQPGLFSLFYALPPTYWSSMLAVERAPVLIQTLLAHHYQMSIHMSAPMAFPPFDKTIFSGIKPLQLITPGDSPSVRDRAITQEFLQFLRTRNTKQSFFGFLFYDTSHSYCDAAPDYATPFQPAIAVCDRLRLTKDTPSEPYMNRYQNAIHFDDQEVGKVLAALQAQGLLKNTVVILTSDHGEQFDENHLNYWGHTSNFTKYQTQTPFIMYWPGKGFNQYSYLTTHYDLVPTLMQQVFRVKNTVTDYAVGRSLFAAGMRPFFIQGSYLDYAVRTLDGKITTVFPEGNYTVENDQGQLLPDQKLNLTMMRTAWTWQNKYYQAS